MWKVEYCDISELYYISNGVDPYRYKGVQSTFFFNDDAQHKCDELNKLSGLKDSEVVGKFKAVVSYISFFDNELMTEIVQTDSKCWKEALIASRFYKLDGDRKNWINSLDDDIEEANNWLFECDEQVAVTWI